VINIKLPKELVLPIQQYLIFFKEYTRTAKGKEVNLNIVEVTNGIEISYSPTRQTDKEIIIKWFEEYIQILKDNIYEENPTIKKIEAANNVSENEIQILILKLENQISHLRNSLKIAELKNRLLEDKYNDIKQLALSYATQENVIKTQIITGGDQQFANHIKNEQ